MIIKGPDGAVAVLREARELLAKGWTQGVAVRQNEDGRKFCLTGAIGVCGGSYDQKQRARTMLGLLVAPLLIEAWNDVPGRTQEEVLALVDTAIANGTVTP